VKAQNFLFSSALLGLGALLAACTGSIGDDSAGPSGSSGPGSSSSSTSSTATSSTTSTGPTSTGAGGGNSMCNSATAGPYTATRIWRLSDEQYANVVTDLVPGSTVPAISTSGRTKDEFINMAEQLPVTGTLTSSLRTSVKAVAAAAVMNLPGLLKCQTGQAEPACIDAFIDRFGSRAFRHPLDATEKTGLKTVYDVGAKITSANGVRVVIEAILQSPSFLYRSELGARPLAGQTTQLTPYELASALSFLVLDSQPDDQLWAAAQDGSLAQAAIFSAQVDRLLMTPRVRSVIGRVYLK